MALPFFADSITLKLIFQVDEYELPRLQLLGRISFSSHLRFKNTSSSVGPRTSRALSERVRPSSLQTGWPLSECAGDVRVPTEEFEQ